MKNLICITERYLMIIAFLVITASHTLADQPIRYGYPALDGRFAMPVVRIDKNENFVRIINTNKATPDDAEYVQCMDPVFYDRPVLIGQKNSLWQFVQNLKTIEIYIHHGGKVIKHDLPIETQTTIARSEIVADSKQNYLVIFLKSEQKLKAVKFISVSGVHLEYNDWSGISDCELCQNADWSAIQEKWFKVISSERGPILIWNDFSDPPKFHSMFIGISQFNGTQWSDQLILDLDYADSNQDAISFGEKIVVSWYSKDPKTTDNKIMVADITKNQSGINIQEFYPQDTDGKYIKLDRRKALFYYQNKPVLFVSYHNYIDKHFHLTGNILNENDWNSLGEIATYSYSINSEIVPCFTGKGELSVLVNSDITFIVVYRDEKWTKLDEIDEDWYFLETLNRIIEVDSEKYLIPYP